jgi:D-xylose transport system substrate-binding protein
MARSRGARLASLGAAAALMFAAAACGGGDNGGGGGGGSSSTTIGVILPDTTSSPRWEASDRPALEKAFSDAGLESDIQNADGDVGKFGTICDGMINEGVSVLMIVNLDSDSGAACLHKAADAGIKSIDYDRLTLGGGASYYVSFDNVQVGSLMGKGLIQCLDKMGKTQANIVQIDGDPTDNNASLFKQGYEEALKPKFDSGDYKLVGDQTGKWDATIAGTAFEQLFTQANGDVDGVIAANDTMAGGIIAILDKNKIAGKVPVTGQDASVEGLQRILAGTQCMTVYKNGALEAEDASKLAIDLAKGDTAAANQIATDTIMDTTTHQEVPFARETPVSIFQNNVHVVTDEGYQKASDVCTGNYASLCSKYGVK